MSCPALQYHVVFRLLATDAPQLRSTYGGGSADELLLEAVRASGPGGWVALFCGGDLVRRYGQISAADAHAEFSRLLECSPI